MAKLAVRLALILNIALLSFPYTTQLEYTQSHSLWKIFELLNYPKALRSIYNTPDFCDIQPSQSFTLVCYENNLTQFHMNGENGVLSPPKEFAIDEFFTTLSSFSSLKVLSLVSLGLKGTFPGSIGDLSSLEILNISSNQFHGAIPEKVSSLVNLQTLILDYNSFAGKIPDWLGSSLPVLAVLSLKYNSFSGSLPDSFSKMENLRVLDLSENKLFGEIPNLSNLTNLQVLDLENNNFGPRFPSLPNRLTTLVLRKNGFSLGLPVRILRSYQLQKFDVSMNGFVGPFLPKILSLPSIRYIDIGGNKFTGMLFQNMSCNPELAFVNLSSNLLTGDLPSCLQSDGKTVLFSENCISTGNQDQHPSNFCHNEALAVEILPPKQKAKKAGAKSSMVFGVLGGVFGGVAIVALVSLIARKMYSREASYAKPHPTRMITENASTVCTMKLLSDARYISQIMKMGATMPAYRTFSLEELKNATNNFDDSCLQDENSNSQVFTGKVGDRAAFTVRRLTMRKRKNPQYYMPEIERISKLRHSHLLSALGHCIECSPDDSSVCQIYLIFEFVDNGTLRDHILGELPGKKLSWIQRIGAATGVVKGIQFLHTGIVPGVFLNDIKITDVLLNHNLLIKISKYNLPLLSEDQGLLGPGVSLSSSKRSTHSRGNHSQSDDVFDIGVILIEIITGRPIKSRSEVTLLKDLLQVSLAADDASRRSIVDPAIQKECSEESLRTMMEICLRCLSNEQNNIPSVEDVLWNLQFALQVQESGKGEVQSDQEASSGRFSQHG